MDPLSIGLVGCGNISDRYIEHDAHLDAFDIEACADLEAERAEQAAGEFDVEAVLNLTPPVAHVDVCLQALESGKHVYTEKPLATEADDAAEVVETAAERGLLVGATAIWSSPGHEH
jgi:predicted dehydrogenase